VRSERARLAYQESVGGHGVVSLKCHCACRVVLVFVVGGSAPAMVLHPPIWVGDWLHQYAAVFVMLLLPLKPALWRQRLPRVLAVQVNKGDGTFGSESAYGTLPFDPL
jgi:hypothetical protein